MITIFTVDVIIIIVIFYNLFAVFPVNLSLFLILVNVKFAKERKPIKLSIEIEVNAI